MPVQNSIPIVTGNYADGGCCSVMPFMTNYRYLICDDHVANTVMTGSASYCYLILFVPASLSEIPFPYWRNIVVPFTISSRLTGLLQAAYQRHQYVNSILLLNV